GNVDEASSHAFLLTAVPRAPGRRAGVKSLSACRFPARPPCAPHDARRERRRQRQRQQEAGDPGGGGGGQRQRARDGDRGQDGGREKLVVDEEADQLRNDCADHACSANCGLRSTTSAAATARDRAANARIAASPPGQSTPRLSPVQNRPKAESITPTANLSAFSGTRASGRWTAAPTAATTTQAARAPALASPRRPRPAPTAMTMNTTSIPSMSTILNAVAPPTQSNPCATPRPSVSSRVSRA